MNAIEHKENENNGATTRTIYRLRITHMTRYADQSGQPSKNTSHLDHLRWASNPIEPRALYQVSCDDNTEIIASANSNEKLRLVDPSVRFPVAQFIHTILFKATTSENFFDHKRNGFNKLWN